MFPLYFIYFLCFISNLNTENFCRRRNEQIINVCWLRQVFEQFLRYSFSKSYAVTYILEFFLTIVFNCMFRLPFLRKLTIHLVD